MTIHAFRIGYTMTANLVVLFLLTVFSQRGTLGSAVYRETAAESDEEVHIERRVEPVTVATAIAIAAAIDIGTKVLNSIDDYFFEDEAKACYWNEWKERDDRARIERTFRKGRFDYEKKTLIFTNGVWYCAYKQMAAVSQHMKLDRVKLPYCKAKRYMDVALSQATRQIPVGGIAIPIYPAVKSAVTLGMKLITGVTKEVFETEAIVCYFDDSAKRNRRARKEKTHTSGRMSMYKKSFGIKRGKWFCAWKMAALIDLGHPLDGDTCVKHFCELYVDVCGKEDPITFTG